jgi:hypothetical protein
LVVGRPARKAKARTEIIAGWLRFLFMVSRGVKGATRGLTGHSAAASPYDLPRQKRHHENAASLRYALPLVFIPGWPPSP